MPIQRFQRSDINIAIQGKPAKSGGQTQQKHHCPGKEGILPLQRTAEEAAQKGIYCRRKQSSLPEQQSADGAGHGKSGGKANQTAHMGSPPLHFKNGAAKLQLRHF